MESDLSDQNKLLILEGKNIVFLKENSNSYLPFKQYDTVKIYLHHYY